MNKLVNIFKNKLWIGPVITASILRLYQLTYSSIWHDEGYTMWLLRYNFIEIIKRDIRDVHPPGYYLISKVWVSLFGNSVFSIRFLSLLFSVGIVYITFLIVKRLFNEKAAFWSTMLLAFSPFMIRFGQEARMYGVVAFFTTLATYYLVKFLQDKKRISLLWYMLAMILAVYNQYYAFFVVISHWIIVAIVTPDFFRFNWIKSFKEKLGIFNPWWWAVNFGILLAYLPWFPIAYKQVTRVSGSYWIKPEWITFRTIPSNILQFITYTHLDDVYAKGVTGKGLYWLLVIVLLTSGLWLWKQKEKRAELLGMYIFGLLPMILVFTLSKLRTPVYQDRYFPFSAIGLFVLWGTTIAYIKNKYLRLSIGILFIFVMIFGNFAMRYNVNHQMKALSDTVKRQAKTEDLIVSGELYTFLDGAYYIGYDRLKWLSGPVDGYGETSLMYDKQDYYLVSPDKDLLPDRLWLIGKDNKDYFKKENWPSWTEVNYFDKGGLRASLYTREN